MKPRHFVARSFAVTKNKTLEIQMTQWNNVFQIGLNLGWTRRCDHAGLRFSIEILGFYLGIEFTDNRHWDHASNAFQGEPDVLPSEGHTAMNEWITDRLPRESDAYNDPGSHCHECVAVQGWNYKLYRKWYSVLRGDPWQPVQLPESYEKPKGFTSHL